MKSDQDHSAASILVVDDEQDNLDAFRFAFRRSFQLHYALSAEEALGMLDAVRPAVVVTDQRMPRMTGIELLKEVAARRPSTVGILVTAYTDLPILLAAIHSGAVYRYVRKPWDSKELSTILRQALHTQALEAENARLRAHLASYAGYLANVHQDPLAFGELNGPSPAMSELQQAITDAAATEGHVLISGERGSGIGVVARAIHAQSARETRPFVELFAHAYGAEEQLRELLGWSDGYLAAGIGARAGRVALAQSGTLFIAHADRLLPPAQAQLANLIATGAITPLGASGPERHGVRLMLGVSPGAKGLRSDIVEGLGAAHLKVPALRQRRADLSTLIKHLLTKFRRRHGQVPHTVGVDAMQQLRTYPFPGNTRELENILERAALACDDGEIRSGHLSFGQHEPHPSLADGTAETIDLSEKLEEVERRELYAALKKCKGNKAEVARMLGVQRTTLYYRLKRLGIEL